ncbi:MAG: outer membrane lipoprotein carrier protein LolA [Bacilli bacterium]|nr:outer membrane lipoprotein carrier protein LolA [Bacilli bacterium]
MKKVFFICLVLVSFLIVGCGKHNDKDIVKDLSKKINKAKGYYLEGEMEIYNNDIVFKYDVSVSYEQKNNYRVSLKNIDNNHEQIILKNEDGVYVLTPSLNKSFKFQSEWPYNNSQVYLLQSIIKDLEGDKQKVFEEKEGHYILTTKVNYPNNRKLVQQKIYLDDKLNFKEVHVLDENNNPQIKMKFTSVDMKATFNKTYFSLNENMKASLTVEQTKAVSSIGDIIYPLYIPSNTHLVSQDKVEKDKGERILLSFDGDGPFMLIQETVDNEGEHLVIPTYGEPELLIDTIGAVSDSSINWISNGIEYYLASSVLEKDELIEIAKSIGVLPVAK